MPCVDITEMVVMVTARISAKKKKDEEKKATDTSDAYAGARS